MQPIQDIAELREGNVLYHSAFGFARVHAIREADVQVAWEQADRNLPRTVSRDALRRAYSLCRAGGFFERALLDRPALREALQVDPLGLLELLLGDLAGPQSAADVREWLVALDIVPEATYDRWWRATEAAALKDRRFRLTKGLLSLAAAKPRATPARELDDPLLTPARRLDLALELRGQIGEEAFRTHAVASWRAGGTQVRELAFQALATHHPNLVLAELLGPGPDNAEALIHAMRRSGWNPDQFDRDVLERLLDRVREVAREPSIPDTEARLAASLARWWPDGGVALLADLARDPRTQPLVQAALGTMPAGRAEALHLSVLARAIDENYRPAAGWLAWLLIDGTGESAGQLADRVESRYALIARWLRENMPSDDVVRVDDEPEEAPLVTMEVELVPLGEEESLPLGDLPRRSGRSILGLAAAIADALAQAHQQGQVVNPTGRSFVLQLDGSVELQPQHGDPEASPRPSGEPPSQRADVYAAAVLLIEAMLGRIWPRNVPADRVLPYLRHVVPDLPPAAMAAFDQALHPDPSCRPANGAHWLRTWSAIGSAEARRALADGAATRPMVVGYDTHIGFTKMLNTQTNQDALAVSSRDGVHLLAVCDGISTANTGSGDLASGITASVLSSLWEQNHGRLRGADDFSAEAFIERALALANRAVCQQALQLAQGDLVGRVPMGTTVVVAAVRGSRVQVGWLGDSRAYLVGPYGASLLTADMNQAGDRLRSWHAGHELAWDPAGYALVGYIGHFAEDMRAEPLVPSQTSFTLLPGERLVLCTDGVTDYVAAHHPAASLVVHQTVYNVHPIDAAVGLTLAANRGGGGDNCTAIVATLLPASDDATEEIHE
jgi:serine/threonine protein phosphatase PrpC